MSTSFNETLLLVFQLVVLIFSVIIHEISHGAVALRLGDQTAKHAGRLTINPLRHLDPMGSFAVPLMLFFLTSGSFVLGWAKPVPYNPLHLRKPKRDSGLIAAAGPISNLLIAAIFGFIFRVSQHVPPDPTIDALILLFNFVIMINIGLAVFNLLPFPPLDGSGVLFSLLPRGYEEFERFLVRYGFVFLILFVWVGFDLIEPLIAVLYRLIAGVSF